MDCCNGNIYNKYDGLQNLTLYVIQYLMLNNEDIWKLLKYDTQDALERPNLKREEKAALIYRGNSGGDMDDYRVFRTPYLDDITTSQQAQLRVYLESITPDTLVYGTVDINIEVLCHVKMIELNDYQNRIESLVWQVLKTLNGVEVGGIGKLFFDRNGSFYDLVKMNRYNNRNFYGYTITMSTKMGNLEECQ
nr:MAG TPA: hypothetical protein [Caudoviricetes sp.]